MILQTGAEYTVRARSIGSDGAGVCDINGFVVFTRGLLPGECANVRITDVRSSYARAVVQELRECSADRVVPVCKYFGICGGCDFMHAAYARELEFKREIIANAFSRIAGIKNAYIQPVTGDWNLERNDFSQRYRNKGQYAYSDNGFGFRAAGTRTIVPVSDCLLQKERNAAILTAISDWAATTDSGGYIPQSAVIRTSEASGDILLILRCVSGADALENRAVRRVAVRVGRPVEKPVDRRVEKFADARCFQALAEILKTQNPDLRSVVVNMSRADRRVGGGKGNGDNIPLYGDGVMYESVGPFRFRVSNDAFFQVNTKMAEKLYATALDLADIAPGDRVFDFFCGTGAISAFLASRAGSVTGIDSSGEAIEDARENAARNGLSNLTFIKGRAEETAAAFSRDKARPDLIVLDPPRSGCAGTVIEAIKALGAGRIVYIACDPATLCRDISRLTAGGVYTVAAVRPIDMFPRTANIETVALLVRTWK